MKMSNIPRNTAYLWSAKKIWHRPGKAKVLIYDRVGADVFLKYLDHKSIEIWDVRRESLNLYVLFKCLLSWKLSMADYGSQYLSYVKPSVALTFIDTSTSFYLLKNHQKNLTTVVVQNGLRGEIAGNFKSSKKQTDFRNKYRVDYMLTFGNAIGREYAKYVDGKILPIGSFRNNLYQTTTQKSSKSVVFISTYKSTEEDYRAEEFVLPLLQKHCLQNQLELKICMRCRPGQIEYERKYFGSLLGNEPFELLERSSVYSSYKHVAAAEFVVFVDSALGYETLARGKRTAAFTVRGKLDGEVGRNFGWPADLPDNGPFWTNNTDERQFKRIMDYLTTVSDEEWEQTWRRYVPQLIEYDPGNTRFLKLMREIGVPLKREYMNHV